MTAELILRELTARGVRVWAEADRLKLDAPSGALTEEDKARLVECKAELLELLARPEPRIGAEACPVCGGALLSESGKSFRHVWCPAGHLDGWRAENGARLGHVASHLFGE